METTAAFKQEDQVKESLSDINESQESVPVPSKALDISQHIELFSAANGDGSDTSNPISPYIGEHSRVVYTETHNNDTRVRNEDVVRFQLCSAFGGGSPTTPSQIGVFGQKDPFEEMPNDKSLCCIYKVPTMIRSVNKKLYTPQVISIGPLHHNKSQLADMEEKKQQYVENFFRRITKEKKDGIVSFIKNKEKQIRACYTEVSSLKSPKFVTMILNDSIFIIEIFLRNGYEGRQDILLNAVPIKYGLWTDLQLFENQLPYFLLEEIYKLAFGGDLVTTFKELSDHFFGKFMGVRLSDLPSEVRVKHFTDWRRISLLKNYERPKPDEKEVVRDLPCAVKLHESGLKFKFIEIQEDRSLLDIKFEKPKHLFSFFEANTLQIPQLEVWDETECLLRNIMALEQCLYPDDAKVCNYVQLMDYLINTAEDVDLLVENNIISNYMGDNASVATMFNRLNQHVVARPSSYHNLCEQLKEHYKNPWNRARATLRGVYFNNPWRGTATVAAIILLLLTIAQTVFSILQVVFK